MTELALTLCTGNEKRCTKCNRFEPSLGYVPGNVAVISGRANYLKSNGTVDEHERLAAWMRAFRGED